MWANQISEQLSKLVLVVLLIFTALLGMSPVIYAAYLHLSGSDRPILWTMPYDITMPFDIGTPVGYLTGMGMQFFFLFCNCLHIVVADITYFGGCLFAMSYINDLRDFYRLLDEEYVRSNNKRVLRQNLIKAVRMQLIFGEWFKHFAQISSGFIFFEIGGNALTTSAAIFLFLVSIHWINKPFYCL